MPRAAILLLTLTLAAAPRTPVQRTMTDMLNIAVALESLATDTNQYPNSINMVELARELSPTYIRHVPMRDAWDTEFLYVTNDDRTQYRLASAGSDGTFEARTGDLENAMPVETTEDTRDLIFQNGEWIQSPKREE